MPELKITFEWDGKTVHKETNGFVGKDCEELTSFLEREMGGKDIVRQRKDVYNVNTNKQRKTVLTSDLRLGR
jgi:hypothetical protein